MKMVSKPKQHFSRHTLNSLRGSLTIAEFKVGQVEGQAVII